MALFTEATYHDRQRSQTLVPQNTSSNTFVPIVGISLTTNDLNQPADYNIMTCLIFSVSSANTIITLRLLVNGTPEGVERAISVKTSNQDYPITLPSEVNGLVAGDVITGEYKTDKGTVTIQEATTSIHGIPLSRLV